jgi:hypothetical protein
MKTKKLFIVGEPSLTEGDIQIIIKSVGESL